MKKILILCIVLIVGCSQDLKNDDLASHPLILEDPQEECARVEGGWMTFNNGCVDSCFAARSDETPICTMALTDSCDCGPERCWNGETCEDN